MTVSGDGGGEDAALGRRSLLGALAVAASGGFASTAGAQPSGDVDPGGPSPDDHDRVVVDLVLDIRTFLLYPQAAVPVALVPEESLDPDNVVEESLRLGPPDVVDDDGGASPVDGDGGGDLVYHFPATDTGFGFGDTQMKLVGRTADGRKIVGTAGVSGSDPGPTGPGSDEDGDEASGDDDDSSGSGDDGVLGGLF